MQIGARQAIDAARIRYEQSTEQERIRKEREIAAAEIARRQALELAEQQRGVAPGQSAVLYEPDPERGDRVLGQGAVLSAA